MGPLNPSFRGRTGEDVRLVSGAWPPIGKHQPSIGANPGLPTPTAAIQD